jgi:uncharacterized protein (TIGR03437 family)
VTLIRVFVACSWISLTGIACAQGIITTIAGTDFAFPRQPPPALQAPIGTMHQISLSSAGVLYFCDPDNNIVIKVDSHGILTIVAGNGTSGFSGDGGPAIAAALTLYSTPASSGCLVDRVDNLYISDSGNNVIRKVTPDGIINTIAGTGNPGYSGDGGSALSADLNDPSGLFLDSAGDLFFADTGNNVIREITADGRIITVAGNGSADFSGDGKPAIQAALNQPISVFVGPAGEIYIADNANNRVRRVNRRGIIETTAGTGVPAYGGDGGPATKAPLFGPSGLFLDNNGNLYIADTQNQLIRMVTPQGIIHTVAGTPAANGFGGFSGDGGPATAAMLNDPSDVVLDGDGSLYIADLDNERIRRVDQNGIINTVVGNGAYSFSGDGGPAISASFYSVGDVVVDSSGNLFISDVFNNRIRRVDRSGIINTVAGIGNPTLSGDGGPAVNAGLNAPVGLAIDAAGNLLIADTTNGRVRLIDTSGIIHTVAGNDSGNIGDGGPAINATLIAPTALALDTKGNIFIADAGAHVIRKVNTENIISTVAGNGMPDFSGDMGPAVSASLNSPSGVAVDSAGNIFISDTMNSRIRKVDSSGIISTVAGSGTLGFGGDGGPATAASLNNPAGIILDKTGSLVFADSMNGVIRRIDRMGIISTVAGQTNAAFPGDGGPAVLASIPVPTGLAFDAAGNLFIAQSDNGRVREVLAQAPTAQVSPLELQFKAPSGAAATPIQTLTFAASTPGLAFSLTIPPGHDWLHVSPESGSAPRLIEVYADPFSLSPGTYRTSISVISPNALAVSSVVAVTFLVTKGTGPTLMLDKSSLSFPFPEHGIARSQSITVSNAGGGKLDFTAMASAVAGGPRLSVSPASGEASPGGPVKLTVTADPKGVVPGTYSGEVAVTAGPQIQGIPVTMTISIQDEAILLSQTGLSFLGVSQGGVLPAQAFGVLNIGIGDVGFTVSAKPLPGGQDWLQVAPKNGISDASATSVPELQVGVNTASLPPGKYYGMVVVDAPRAANTPQVVTVFAQVLNPDADVGAVLQPAELLFTATTGGESPGSQYLYVYNVAKTAKSFRSSIVADAGLNLVILPTDATLDPQQPTRVVVQPFTNGLAAGVYNTVITLQFSDGRVLSANVRVIVAAVGSSQTSSEARMTPRSSSTGSSAPCTATKLLPALTTLGQSFTVSAGYPVALSVDVKDDCGAALTDGAVTVSFSNGDPMLTLQSLKDGRWQGTWTTPTKQAQLTLTVQANDSRGIIQGQIQVQGALNTPALPPVFAKKGIVSSAGRQQFVPIAPGSIISIFGDQLGQETISASTAPLGAELAGTMVLIAGRPMPLYYVSPRQINAVVPFETNFNTTQQILVSSGGALSLPVSLDVAPAQPAVFTNPNGVPRITDVPADKSPPYQVTAETPASPGDNLTIYCEGLGLTDPKVVDGAASPSNPQAHTTRGVAVTIGGVNAPVQFAGLIASSVGLYQINAFLPKGVPSGREVPLTITVAGQMSPKVTIAIQ